MKKIRKINRSLVRSASSIISPITRLQRKRIKTGKSKNITPMKDKQGNIIGFERTKKNKITGKETHSVWYPDGTRKQITKTKEKIKVIPDNGISLFWTHLDKTKKTTKRYDQKGKIETKRIQKNGKSKIKYYGPIKKKK